MTGKPTVENPKVPALTKAQAAKEDQKRHGD